MPLPPRGTSLLPGATIGATMQQGTAPIAAVDVAVHLPQKRPYKRWLTATDDQLAAGMLSPKQAGHKRCGRGQQ
jgi:hypothetical protein